jgi:hypothetical protein
MTLAQHERVDDQTLALPVSIRGFPNNPSSPRTVTLGVRPKEDSRVQKNSPSDRLPVLFRGSGRVRQYIFPKRRVGTKRHLDRARLHDCDHTAVCSERYSSLEGEDDGLLAESFVEYVIDVRTRAEPTGACRLVIDGGRCRRLVDERGECLREWK